MFRNTVILLASLGTFAACGGSTPTGQDLVQTPNSKATGEHGDSLILYPPTNPDLPTNPTNPTQPGDPNPPPTQPPVNIPDSSALGG